jgi:hypothetical protein
LFLSEVTLGWLTPLFKVAAIDLGNPISSVERLPTRGPGISLRSLRSKEVPLSPKEAPL